MAKKKTFVQGMGMLNLLSDRDWITIIAVLIRDGGKEAQPLAETLLSRTKHGRQIRLLRLIHEKQLTIPEMQRTMKVSRRTIFRDLNSLEEYGVQLNVDDSYHYSITDLPKNMSRLL
ncbi:MAG TPA: HTH domain-containing protein [Phycisphaerae bacterium]|nr:HTH domain-containing protein [Phycisphaerae bacterium]